MFFFYVGRAESLSFCILIINKSEKESYIYTHDITQCIRISVIIYMKTYHMHIIAPHIIYVGRIFIIDSSAAFTRRSLQRKHRRCSGRFGIHRRDEPRWSFFRIGGKLTLW